VLYGVGGSYDKRTGNFSGSSDTYTAYGVHAHAGLYLSFWLARFELLPFVGVGNAKLDVAGVGSDSGHVTEYGANLNFVIFVPVVPLSGGVGVGYLHSESSHSIGGATTDLKADNGTVSLFIGYSF